MTGLPGTRLLRACLLAALMCAVNAPASLAACTATHFAVSTPASATAGTAFNFTVTAEGVGNCVATTYAGTMHFTTSDFQAVLPADATLSSGRGTFSATLKTAGHQTISATDTANSSITTTKLITVSPGPASHFAVSAPATATAGTAFDFVVTALDVFNNTATGYKGKVHFTSSDGKATLPVNSTLTNGTGTFSATLKTAGSQTLTARDSVKTSVTGTSNLISTSAAAASHFAVSAPASATAGNAFDLTVTAQDQFGNLTPGYAGLVHFTSSDAMATLPADATLSNGTGTFSATLTTAGDRTITATDTTNSSITGTSNSIIVAAAAATHFGFSAPTEAAVGNPFHLTVTALDQFGNRATGYSGTIVFGSSDSAASLPPNSKLTAGVGVFTATLNTVGSQGLEGCDSMSVFVCGSASSIAVGPAETHLTVTGPSAVTAGAPFHLTVTARDSGGHVVPGYTGTVHFTSTDSHAALPANATLSGGTGTFTATLKTAGSHSITAIDTKRSSVRGSISATVVHASTARLLVVAKSPQKAGRAFSFTVIAEDRFGNTTPNYAGSVRFRSSDHRASLPPTTTISGGRRTLKATLRTAGKQRITATDTARPSITGTSNVIRVAPGRAVQLDVTAPHSIRRGHRFRFKVMARDRFGNVDTGYDGTIHFRTSDQHARLPHGSVLIHGVRTFTAVLNTHGLQTITARDRKHRSLTAQIRIRVT